MTTHSYLRNYTSRPFRLSCKYSRTERAESSFYSSLEIRCVCVSVCVCAFRDSFVTPVVCLHFPSGQREQCFSVHYQNKWVTAS